MDRGAPRGRGRGNYGDQPRGRGGYHDQSRGGRGSYGPPRGAPQTGSGPDGDDRRQFYSGPPPSARGFGGPRPSRGSDFPRGGYGQRGAHRSYSTDMPPPRFPLKPRCGQAWSSGEEGVKERPCEDFPPAPGGKPWGGSRETSSERASSVSSDHRKAFESDFGSLVSKPDGSGDKLSASSSTEALSGPARQKKKHPIMRPGSDLADALSKMSMQKSLKIPGRPDQGGSCGQRCEVIANCWNIQVISKTVIMYFIETVAVYRRDKEKEKVEVKLPPKEKRELLQQVVDSLHQEVIYDGGHTIYTENPIPGITKEDLPKEMDIRDPLNRDQLVIKYRLLEVQRVNTGDVANFIANSKATSLDMPQESIRLFDCILKTICKGSFKSLSRAALFYAEPVKVVYDKLFSIHKGFITSVRPQWKVRVNIDMTCKAFLTSGNLADVMYHKYGDNMMKYAKQMALDLKRVRVETKPFYKNDAGTNYSRRFTVHGFSSEPAATLMIDDVKQTVAEYFEKHHNIKLQYPELPCVKVNLSRDIYLPMELLNILPYQTPNAKKSDIASEVIRCAAIKPEERFKELDGFVRELMRSTHPLVKEYGIKVESQPQRIPARVLETPNASFGHQQLQLGRGKWNTPAFFRPASVNGSINWAILSIPGDRNAQRHQQILSAQMPAVARRFNVDMNRPECAIIQRAEISFWFDKLQKRGVDFVLLVLYDDFSYSTIKRLGDLTTGMRTQCVRGRTLDKPNVIPNLLLKINGKLGGINWQILDVIRNDELIMVFGADVTHPAPTSQNQQLRQSIAAVLGSVTPDLMRYGVVVRQQATTDKSGKKTREIIDAMESIVSELLKVFYRNTNGRFPTRLIFYRDGVSEGQFENVLVEELAAIQKACYGLRPDYEPAITYIVVQKRHHLRFRPLNPRQRNVDPGTVVDTHVTHPREFDFYLCSQDGIQGTSKPAHYHVLYDDSNWTSDALQRFTFFLCHTYMRCPRSVSYPAPTYYAHLAAFRARDWVSDVEKESSLIQDGRFTIHESQITGMYYL